MFRLRWLVVGGLLLCGCGSPDAGGDPTVAVSGMVTLDGQPLATGRISFIDAARGPRREYLGAIKEGEFRCEAPPGSLRVEIRSYTQPASLEEMSTQIIPAKYNDNSGLTAELKLDELAEFTFDLKSR